MQLAAALYAYIYFFLFNALANSDVKIVFVDFDMLLVLVDCFLSEWADSAMAPSLDSLSLPVSLNK